MAAVKHYNWLELSRLLIQRLRFFTELCVMTSHSSCRSLTTNPITNSKMAEKMAAVQGKVTAYRIVVGLTKESLDGASDSLDGDREIKRLLIGRRNMMTRLS